MGALLDLASEYGVGLRGAGGRVRRCRARAFAAWLEARGVARPEDFTLEHWREYVRQAPAGRARDYLRAIWTDARAFLYWLHFQERLPYKVFFDVVVVVGCSRWKGD